MRSVSCLLVFFVFAAIMNISSVKATASNQADYEFAAIEHLVEQEIGKIILSAIYQELGLNIHITSYSGNRAQYEANSGQKAGEIMRIWSYGAENNNLIRVPTPYYSFVTSAFTRKNSAINISKASDLAGYKIARVRGVKHTNNITKNLLEVSDSPSTEAMFKLVQQGHVDIALTSHTDGIQLLKKLKLENEIMVSESLANLKLYHYIHKDHKSLVNKVDKVIKQLQSSGKLVQIIQAAEATVLNTEQVRKSPTIVYR